MMLLALSVLAGSVSAIDDGACTTGVRVRGSDLFDGDYTDQTSIGYAFTFGNYYLGASFVSDFGSYGCERGCSDEDARLARGKWTLKEAQGPTGCGEKSSTGMCKLYAVCEDCPEFMRVGDNMLPTWPAAGTLKTRWHFFGNNATVQIDIGCCKRRVHECDTCSHKLCAPHTTTCPPPFWYTQASKCCEYTPTGSQPADHCKCKDVPNECELEETLESMAV
eukprot:TRINITY_DN12064_c0_g1_i2.p1 TRINITY_DN12064_c0_g1~~TRINITY_DN12064_c0_g1_i2.p1  ORF type:complete len:221 (+),score=30.86 TRINITY_DN12064_c0_g1_i2:55-717(+)